MHLTLDLIRSSPFSGRRYHQLFRLIGLEYDFRERASVTFRTAAG